MTRGLALAPFLIVVPMVLIGALAEAATSRPIDFPLRGKTLTLQIYYPVRTPLATIIMGSGDAGWTGLSLTMAEFLSDRGYLVIGFNSQQYLSAFRNGNRHLTVDDPPADFREMIALLRAQHLCIGPVLLSGMSEGAALAVLVAADPRNHTWIDGLITMGIPSKAELAWKWTDILSLIRKTDPDEPSFAPFDFVGLVAPVPFVMLQSKTDEYVPVLDYQQCHANANHPKKLVIIDASNHRFTDRRPELQLAYLAAVVWVQEAKTR